MEVLGKPGNVMKYRSGKLGFDKVLLTDEVFTDAKKGKKASLTEVKVLIYSYNEEHTGAKPTEIKCMGDAARFIVDHGDVCLTTAERAQAVRARRAEVVEYIHKYFIDPKTKKTHPIARIDTALDNIKLRVDADTPLDRIVSDALKLLPDVLPLKKVLINATITIPHVHVGAVQAVVSKRVTIERQQYNADGCTMTVSLCPGDYESVLKTLERIGKGDIIFDVNISQCN